MRKTDKQRRERVVSVPQPDESADFVCSTAGRDTGMVLIRMARRTAPQRRNVVTDRRHRGIAQPKFKNPKHLKVLAPVPDADWQSIIHMKDSGAANARIRKLISEYMRRESECQKKM